MDTEVNYVFPAYAGMILAGISIIRTFPRVPRIRRDDPECRLRDIFKGEVEAGDFLATHGGGGGENPFDGGFGGGEA
ncbi:MAG: hypothetical protein LBJ14_04760 [Desulfarculales bacterium]|jgi:hypothetical protein|nr:hypothetical protein [Desulfarculales bacterium]